MIDDPEGPHPHHGGSGIKWLDLALAVAVIVLSAASLWTANHTGKTMEKLVAENSRLVRANSTPILQWDTGNVIPPSTRAISFTVSNVGTGTARVIWFEVRKDGVAMPNINRLIEYVPRAGERDYITTGSVGGTYLPVGATRALVSWPYPAAPLSQAKWNQLDRDRFGLAVTACFCSVFDECWTSQLRADLPKPVKSCDARGRTNFTG